MRKILLMVILTISALAISAQEMTKEQQKLMQQRAQKKVALFTSYLEMIANKNESLDYRQYYKDSALKLFVGQGNAYQEIHVSETGSLVKVEREGVKMEVSSTNRSTRSNYLLRTYLTNLANLKYQKVTLQSTELANIRVSNIQRVGENVYKCVCFFKQAFVGYREGKPVYADITEKKVECYILKEDTVDGAEFVVLLGNVTALETSRVNPNSLPEL